MAPSSPGKPSPEATKRANSRRPRDKKSGKYVSKFTPDTGAQICEVIRAGNYIETAAAYAGVHKDTFYEWMKRGRDAQAKPVGRRTVIERQLAEFVAEVEQSLAQAEVRDLAIIGKASAHVWQAAAWRLERRMPNKYGRRTRVDHDTTDGKPLQVAFRFDPDQLSDDEIDRLDELLAKAQEPDGDR